MRRWCIEAEVVSRDGGGVTRRRCRVKVKVLLRLRCCDEMKVLCQGESDVLGQSPLILKTMRWILR